MMLGSEKTRMLEEDSRAVLVEPLESPGCLGGEWGPSGKRYHGGSFWT